MTGNDLENLLGLLRVKLRSAGVQQDGFTPKTKGQYLAQRGVGMKDHLRITDVAACSDGNQPGGIVVQGDDHLLVDQVADSGWRQSLMGNEST